MKYLFLILSLLWGSAFGNSYYTPSGTPAQGAALSSASMRNEFTSIGNAFVKLPDLTATPSNLVISVNSAGNALIATSNATVLANIGAQALNANLTSLSSASTTQITSALSNPITQLATSGISNVIIDGNFSINQRSVTSPVSLGAGIYGHDRWKGGSSGAAYTFSTTNNATTINIGSGSIRQIIEGAQLYSGSYTLSWAGTAQCKVGAGSYGATGIIVTVVGGVNTTVECAGGTLAFVMFQPGVTGSPYFVPYNGIYGGELQAAQRYLPAFSFSAAGQMFASSFVNTATELRLFVNFPVPSRVPPTGIVQSNINALTVLWPSNSGGNLSNALNLTFASKYSAGLHVAVSGAPVGYSGYVYSNGANTIYFDGCEL